MKTDYEVLDEMLDVIEHLRQLSGPEPGRCRPSSLRKLREDLGRFRDDCDAGRLARRACKRKSGELFRRVVSLHPEVWET